MAKGDTVLDLEQVLFVLQKKNPTTQEWVTQGKHTYRGKTDANTVLRRIRNDELHEEEEWRTLLKQEAERYREGWNDCAEYVERVYGVVVDDEEFDSSPVVPGSGSTRRSPGNRVRPPQGGEG